MNRKPCCADARSRCRWTGILLLALIPALAQGQTITVTGDYSPIYNGTDNPWNAAGHLTVGGSAAGTMTISGGAVVEDVDGYVGLGVNGDGTVTVTGSGSQWNHSSDVAIGSYGKGALNVEAGAVVSASDVSMLGLFDTGSGTGVVTGAGSQWITTKELSVGYHGSGMLSVLNSGSISSDGSFIGREVGSSGAVTVDGSGSTWTEAYRLRVGNSGTGTLDITNGGSVDVTDYVYVGSNSTGDGTLTISGAGSQLSTDDQLRVGHQGTGSMTVSAGGKALVATDLVAAGNTSSSQGTITVQGAGSMIMAGDNAHIGLNGTGALNILNGATVSNTATAFVGDNASGQGTVTVNGSGSTWTNSSSLLVGNNGTGTLLVQAGGIVSNTGDGNIGNNAGATGTVTVNGSGSTWVNSQSLRVGATGEGTLNVQAGGSVSYVDAFIGATGSAVGMATVTGTGSQLTGSGDLYVGPSAGGTLNVEAGGVASNSNGFIGVNSAGTGTATVTGAGSEWNNSGDLYVAGNASRVGGSGSLMIQDSGQVNVTGTTKIWGPGTITLDGGNLTTGSFDNTAGGTFNFNDGTLKVNGGAFQPGSGDFTLAGGSAASNPTLTLSNNATWSAATVTVGSSAPGTLNIESGSVVSNSVYTFIGNQSGIAGTATVTGTGSQWNTTSNFFVGRFGTGELSVEAGGLVSTGGGGYIGDRAGSNGMVTVSGTGSRFNSTSNLVVANAGTGTFVVESGGVLASNGGFIGSAAGSNGTVSVTGTGSQWNSTGEVRIGNAGIGGLTVQNGGVVTNTWGIVGAATSGNGTATVNGAGSQWNNNGPLYVGLFGTGSLNVEAGGLVSNSNNGFVAARTASSGTAIVTGAGSQWNNSDSLYVGGRETIAGGTGSVDIVNGGAVNVGDTLKIYSGSSLTRDASSSLTAAHVDTNGSLNWGGTLNVSSALASSAVGDISATGGGSLNGDTLHIYSDGSVSLDASSSLVANHIIADGNLDWAGGTLNVDTNQVLSGSGDLSDVGMINVANGGILAPGNSTGTMTAGDVTWGPGGMFEFEVNDFNGTAGSSTLGWDLLAADSIDITATALNPFEIDLLSLTSAQTAGMADNFDLMSNYSLMFASATTGITGFSAGVFEINTSGFQNTFAGNWFVSQTGNNLFLNYAFDPAAIPEPSSIALLGLGSLSLVVVRRRKCRVTSDSQTS